MSKTDIADSKAWLLLCGRLQDPRQWDDQYQGQFLQRVPWKEGCQIQTNLEQACEKRQNLESKANMHLIPMRFLAPVYRAWITTDDVRRVLEKRLGWWIRQQVHASKIPRQSFTPLDYHLLLQLCFDLDRSDYFETILAHAKRVAQAKQWPSQAYALWNQIY